MVSLFNNELALLQASTLICLNRKTPFSSLNDHPTEFPQDGEFRVFCAGGYRSIVAASILKARGIHNMIDVQGGYGAIESTNSPKSDYVCPSTL